jgi:xanthine dehydrogenase molybdopterin-binding subunit B
MLAISVHEAIRDAVAAFGKTGGEVELRSRATRERGIGDVSELN